MRTDYDSLKNIDSVKIKNALEYQVPIEVTTYTLPKSMEAYIRGVLNDFLTTCHQPHMIEYLNFCLGELLTNAKKANTKRVYFEEKGLDINNQSQYDQGMEHFKEDTIKDLNHYLELQKKAGLYIKFLLQIRSDSSVRLEVKNNCTLTSFERQRIQNKLESAKQYSSIEEVMMSVMDQTEGAGLGIIIMILMLQKIGLSKENYRIFDTEGETITQLFLPCDVEIQKEINNIFMETAKSMTTLPVSETNFKKLQSLINGSCNKTQLYDLFKKDAVLAYVLVSNSLKKNPSEIRISKIVEATSQEEFQSYFPVSSDKFALIKKEEFERILFAAHKVAVCAYNISGNYPQNDFDAEEMYTIGLFSILGRVLYSGLLDSQKKVFTDGVAALEERLHLESLYNTETSYSMFSSYMLQLQNFPESVVSLIQKSNCWDYTADMTVSDSVPIASLAQIMTYYEAGKIEYYQINKYLLNALGIQNEEMLRSILSKLEGSF